MAKNKHHIWVVSDGSKGMETQSLGLAEALTATPRLIRLTPPKLTRHLPSLARLPVLPLPRTIKQSLAKYGIPDIVITCGRRHAGVSLLMRRVGAKTIHIQNAKLPPKWFDVVVVPSHDRLRGENVLVTLGSLNRLGKLLATPPKPSPIPPASHLPRPFIAVLIGGSNRRYQVLPRDYSRFAYHLAAVAATTGVGLALIPSPRSLDSVRTAMAAPLAATRHWWWEGKTPNPYPWIVRASAAIIVTADSVNMTSEACTMGKAVYVAELKPETGRVALFQRIMQQGGYTRPLTHLTPHNWQDPPKTRLDETARIATRIEAMLL